MTVEFAFYLLGIWCWLSAWLRSVRCSWPAMRCVTGVLDAVGSGGQAQAPACAAWRPGSLPYSWLPKGEPEELAWWGRSDRLLR